MLHRLVARPGECGPSREPVLRETSVLSLRLAGGGKIVKSFMTVVTEGDGV